MAKKNKITIGIDAESTGFSKHIKTAEQQFKRSMDSISAAAEKSSRSIKSRFFGISLAVGAASLAVRRMVSAVGEWITAANVQERAETKLETTLRNLTDATDEQVEALKEQASALQEVTGYGDESIISAQAMLATFQLTSEQIGKLTPKLLDMAESARKSGQANADLETISIALGKAFTSGIGSLSRYGVAMTDAQKEAFKLADQSEKVAILVEVLDGNFKGLAEAVGNTFEGASRKASAAMGDLHETLGDQFIQNDEFVESTNSLAGAWREMAQGIKDSSRTIGSVISGLADGVRISFGAIQAVWNTAQISFKTFSAVVIYGAELINRAFASITIGDLSEQFKKAADDLAAYNRGLVTSIKQDVDDLETAGRKMTGTYEETSKAARDTAEQAKKAAGEIAKLSDTTAFLSLIENAKTALEVEKALSDAAVALADDTAALGVVSEAAAVKHQKLSKSLDDVLKAANGLTAISGRDAAGFLSLIENAKTTAEVEEALSAAAVELADDTQALGAVSEAAARKHYALAQSIETVTKAAKNSASSNASKSLNDIDTSAADLLSTYRLLGNAAQAMRAGRIEDSFDWAKQAKEALDNLESSSAVSAQTIKDMRATLNQTIEKATSGIDPDDAVIDLDVQIKEGATEEALATIDAAAAGKTVEVVAKIIPDFSLVPASISVPVAVGGADIENIAKQQGGRA